MTANIEKFKNNGFCTIKNCISEDILNIITQYALFDEMQNYRPELKQNRFQVPNAHSIYADPAMESLLLHLQPVIEKNTGLTLFPTYSYYRIYGSGDELCRHKDRPSCEISATLCFNYDYNNKDFSWPIYMEGNKIIQNPGDMTIYRGCDLEHYREIMEIDDPDVWHAQGFFHYVDVNGPYAEWKFDKRNSIGEITRSVEPPTQKPYIINKK